jgi:sulfur carrier protein
MQTIEIHLNGRPHPLQGAHTVSDLIAQLDLNGKSLAVSINRRVIKRAEWTTRRIGASDRIEIVHAIGGG